MREYSLKLVMNGSSYVGKSSICKRIIDKTFEYETNQTIGVDFFTTCILHEGIKFKVHLWDTAGQERFQSITKTYYRNSAGVFCVFDVTKTSSVESLPNWIENVKEISPTAIIVIVANKIDMIKHEDQTKNLVKGKKIAEDLSLDFVEVSSKTNFNITYMIQVMVDSIYRMKIEGKLLEIDDSKGIISHGSGVHKVKGESVVLIEKKTGKKCCIGA